MSPGSFGSGCLDEAAAHVDPKGLLNIHPTKRSCAENVVSSSALLLARAVCQQLIVFFVRSLFVGVILMLRLYVR